MSGIRTKILQEIHENLHRPPLLVKGDFEVSQTVKNNRIFLKILYYLQQDKYFLAEIPMEKSKRSEITDSKPNLYGITSSRTIEEYKIEARFCPGEISQNERISLSSSREMIDAIDEWVSRLVEEIRDEPLSRQIKQQQQQFEDLEELLNQVADEVATEEEVIGIKNYLEHLVEELRLKIEALEGNDKEQAAKIEVLADQLEQLSQRVESTSKRNFIRAILTRVYGVAADPKLAQIAGNAQKIIGLLGGSPGS